MGAAGEHARATLSAGQEGNVKRSVSVAGHRTSVSLEAPFWAALGRLAAARGCSLNQFVTEVDRTRTGNLSSALRVHVLAAARGAAP